MGTKLDMLLFYIRRFLVVTIIFFWNSYSSAIILAVTYLLIYNFHFMIKNYNRNIIFNIFVDIVTFVLVQFVAILFWNHWHSFFLSIIIISIIFLNRFLEILKNRETPVFVPGFLFVAFPLVSQVLAPVAHMSVLIRILDPVTWRSKERFQVVGTTICLGFSFFLPSLIFLSCRPSLPGETIKTLISVPGLYGMALDEEKNRLVVTQTRPSLPCHALDLAALTLHPTEFYIPSAEVEDLVFSPKDGKYYHVDRYNGNLLEIDRDTFITKRVSRIGIPGDYGSVRLSLSDESHRLFASFENGRVWSVLLPQGILENDIPFDGNPILIYDSSTRKLFGHIGNTRRFLSIDPFSMRTISTYEKGPRSDTLMISSGSGKYLFAPDPISSSIWIISIPLLEKIGEIETQFGVRSLATDDTLGLLFAASYITGNLDIIDIKSKEVIETYYIGKYVRKLMVVPSRRLLFITITDRGLLMMSY